MSGRSAQNDAASSRRQAAQLLSRLRASADRPTDEDVELALMILPSSRMVALIAARWMLNVGRVDDASTLLARSLRRAPDHSGLTLERIRCLRKRGQTQRAWNLCMQLLCARRSHVRTMLEAARIALALNRPDDAQLWLSTAAQIGRGSRTTRIALVERLLDHSLVSDARNVLCTIHEPLPVLESKLLLAEGRVRDAIDVLTATLEVVTHDSTRDAAMSVLIDALNRAGDHTALWNLIAQLSNSDSFSLSAAAVACIEVGRWELATDLLERLSSIPGHRKRAQTLMAAVAIGRQRPAAVRSLLVRQQDGGHPLPTASLAASWRKAMIGHLVSHELGGLTSPADPALSVLEPIMRQTFQTLSKSAETPPHSVQAESNVAQSKLNYHLQTTREWLTGSVAKHPSSHPPVAPLRAAA